MYTGKSINVITGKVTDVALTKNEIDAIHAMPEPTPQPRRIDARRLRLALLQLGLLDDIESAITSLGAAAKIEWEYAISIQEDNLLCVAITTQLGLDVDAIFTLAGSLL